jgi:replicative DNA helicase
MKPPDEADRQKAGTLQPNPLADAERARLRVVGPNDSGPTPEPTDVPAEKALLGALLWAGSNQPDLLRVGSVTSILADGTPFYDSGRGDVYNAIKACADWKAEHDPVAVYAALVKMGRDRAVGGLEGLKDLADQASTVSERQARVYASEIQAAWTRRTIISELRLVVEDARDPRCNLAKVSERLQVVAESVLQKATPAATTVSLGESGRQLLQKLESRTAAAMATGLRDVDGVCNGGLRWREVSTLAADTGVGKSMMAAQIAEHIVTQDTSAAAFYATLEMPHTSFTMRLVSARSGVPLSALRKRELTDMQWTRITQAVVEMENKGLFFADAPSQTLAEVYAAALERDRLLKPMGKKIRLVVVDHAGLIKPSAEALKRSNREQQVAEISRGFRWIAEKLECHVMGLVQISRDASGKNNEGMPKLRHLAESYSLARDPDLVFIIHRNRDPKTGKLVSSDPAAFALAKGRMDESAVMLLGFHGSTMRFSNWDGNEMFSDYYGH